MRIDLYILPNVDFSAAGAHVANTSTVIGLRRLPAYNIALFVAAVSHRFFSYSQTHVFEAYLAADELEVTSTLSVTVSSTVLGSSLVVRLRRKTAVFLHGNEIQSTVHAALDTGQVDVESELVVQELEGLVLAVPIHEVHAGANVLAVLMLLDELQGHGIAAGRDAVGAAVLGSLNSASLGAVVSGRAQTSPRVSIITVLVSAGRVCQPVLLFII